MSPRRVPRPPGAVDRSADCRRRGLTSPPTHLPPQLEELLLDDNPVQTLGGQLSSSYPRLGKLSASGCRLELIETGTFLGSARLRTLALADNALSTHAAATGAALRSLPALRRLDLSRNGLTEETAAVLLRNLSSLESLALARNSLMRLDPSVFAGLGNLRELDLQKNYIYEIEKGTFEGLGALERLDLAYNILPCIVDFELTQLRVLNVSNNILEWFLSSGRDAAFRLETLDLSHNRLLFFPLLPATSRLHTLLLADNEMSFYEAAAPGGAAPGGEARPRGREEVVQFLLLDGGLLSVTTVTLWEDWALGDLSSLRFLDLSRNQFRYLPAGFLHNLTALAHLDLNQNCLESLGLREDRPPGASPADPGPGRTPRGRGPAGEGAGAGAALPRLLRDLRFLNLSANRLRGLPAGFFAHAGNITTVDLSHNRIQLCPQPAGACVDFRDAASLRSLSLGGCGLVGLDAQTFRGTALTHLDLSENERALCRGGSALGPLAPTLRVLHLGRAGLGPNCTEPDLSRFRSLRVLGLAGNSLSDIPRALGRLALESLDLRRNGLAALPRRTVAERLPQSLRVLYLGQNPFDCCRVEGWDLLLSRPGLGLPDWARVLCNFSSRGFRVAELPEEVVRDCRWGRADPTLLYLVLLLPTCLTLLVACSVIFLTFKKPLLQVVKTRCHWSSIY
uniref:Negative regulator of reactive oxygen species n=1 Tax=Ornithorhynchus anatinus TaxID=9258 RepID=A0A6I8P2H5_ORNAN